MDGFKFIHHLFGNENSLLLLQPDVETSMWNALEITSFTSKNVKTIFAHKILLKSVLLAIIYFKHISYFIVLVSPGKSTSLGHQSNTKIQVTTARRSEMETPFQTFPLTVRRGTNEKTILFQLTRLTYLQIHDGGQRGRLISRKNLSARSRHSD